MSKNGTGKTASFASIHLVGLGGTGTNTYSWTRTSAARTGSWAENVPSSPTHWDVRAQAPSACPAVPPCRTPGSAARRAHAPQSLGIQEPLLVVGDLHLAYQRLKYKPITPSMTGTQRAKLHLSIPS